MKPEDLQNGHYYWVREKLMKYDYEKKRAYVAGGYPQEPALYSEGKFYYCGCDESNLAEDLFQIGPEIIPPTEAK